MDSGKSDSPQKGKMANVIRLFAVLAIGWTFIILSAAAYRYYSLIHHNTQLAILQARAAFDKDIVFRRWNASKGGVYVPVSATTPPNPYLKVKKRDIFSEQVGKMTLINPSYMTRQIHEIEKQKTGVRSHLTSINPLRPLNIADKWETEALLTFRKNTTEIHSLKIIDGEPFLRYMKPLFVEQACLKCHAKQGYKVDDIRGGISISIPMKPIEDLHHNFIFNSAIIFLGIWLSGIFGIYGGYRKIAYLLQQELHSKRERKALSSQLLQAQKMQAIGEMAAGIAHELNTPIQYVGNNVEFLNEAFMELVELVSTMDKAELDDLPPEASHALVEKIIPLVQELDWEYLRAEIPQALQQSEQGLNHVAVIVEAMKEFSHTGSAGKADADLNQIIENAITVCQNEWKYIATIDNNLARDLPLVPLLIDEIRQVILNMITNAAHAIEEKQKLTGHKETGVIKVATDHDENSVTLTIQDTGTGISDKFKDRIFEPFFTSKEVGKGTGLGLYLCYDIITNKHSGTLKVESTEGVGTTFFITLPL